MRRGAPEILVRCGPGVEIGSGFFVEGAWDGPFEQEGFSAADILLGSGAATQRDRVVFSAASHPRERLHLASRPDELWVSNSLPFVLVASGEALDPEYPFYSHDIGSVSHGLRRARTRLPTRSGASLRLLYCTNLWVDADLELTFEERVLRRDFVGFVDYERFLHSSACALRDNAASAQRRTQFQLTTTVSSGYDSPACAVVAKAAGCVDALTFRDARPGFADLNDSGLEIGRLLGLRVHEASRTDFLSLPGFPEAEFVAAGTGGGDVVFAALEKQLVNRMVFTGFLGDVRWGLDVQDPRDSLDLAFTDPAGISLMEFRLRVGFVHFPLPQTHQGCHPAVHRISTSPEMRPWRVGGRYDRPIPRRLVEEAGVDRRLFGMEKMAVSHPLQRTVDLEAAMSPGSHADFVRFLQDQKLGGMGRFSRVRFRLMRELYVSSCFTGVSRRSAPATGNEVDQPSRQARFFPLVATRERLHVGRRRSRRPQGCRVMVQRRLSACAALPEHARTQAL
jgi:hypothetical protein